MGINDRIRDFFVEPDEDFDIDEDYEEVAQPERIEVTRVVNNEFETPKSANTSKKIQNINPERDGHLVLLEPRSFDDTQKIAKLLKDNRSAVVNLHRLSKDESKRVTVFLSGVIYAIDGTIQVVGEKTYLCTPNNMNVTGEIVLDDDE